MSREEAISIMKVIVHMLEEKYDTDRIEEAVDMAIKALETASCIKEKCAYCPHCEHCDVDDETLEIKALEQEPRKGEWLRMSDLSEQEDDRYKCSRCGNVVHYKSKMNLYTFNSWCGRCGSDNGRKIEVEL